MDFQVCRPQKYRVDYCSRSKIHRKFTLLFCLPCSSTKWDYHLLSASAFPQPLYYFPYEQYEEQCFQTDDIIMGGVWVGYVGDVRVQYGSKYGSWRSVVGEQTLSWESMGQPLAITSFAMSSASCLAARWRHVKPSYNGVWDEFTSWLTCSFTRMSDGMNHTSNILSHLTNIQHASIQHLIFHFLLTLYHQLSSFVAVARCPKATNWLIFE